MIFKSSNSQRLNTGIHTAPRYQLSPYYEPQIRGFFDTHGSSPQTEEIYPVISLYYLPGLICLFSMTFGFVKRCGTGTMPCQLQDCELVLLQVSITLYQLKEKSTGACGVTYLVPMQKTLYLFGEFLAHDFGLVGQLW